MQKRGIDTGGAYYEESSMFHGSLKNIMGTRFDILIIDRDRLKTQRIWHDIVFELSRLDQLFNRFDRISETSRINNRATLTPVPVSPEMWSILQNCQIYHRLTLGLFDITLDNFLKVELNKLDHSVFFHKEGISMDFGGYAKGYALVKIKEITHQFEVKDCFIDFGNSSILGIGHHPYGDAWKVNFENPYKRDIILDDISLIDQALSISGNTPSYAGHIVHPDSKKPAKEHKAISIISKDPLDAEVLSTVFMIASESEKTQIVEKFEIDRIAEYNL